MISFAWDRLGFAFAVVDFILDRMDAYIDFYMFKMCCSRFYSGFSRFALDSIDLTQRVADFIGLG